MCTYAQKHTQMTELSVLHSCLLHPNCYKGERLSLYINFGVQTQCSGNSISQLCMRCFMITIGKVVSNVNHCLLTHTFSVHSIACIFIIWLNVVSTEDQGMQVGALGQGVSCSHAEAAGHSQGVALHLTAQTDMQVVFTRPAILQCFKSAMQHHSLCDDCLGRCHCHVAQQCFEQLSVNQFYVQLWGAKWG